MKNLFIFIFLILSGCNLNNGRRRLDSDCNISNHLKLDNFDHYKFINYNI